MDLFSAAFWRSIGWLLVRTAIAGITPFVPALAADPAGAWPAAVSTVGLLLIVAAATSVRGTVDPDTAPWWQVLLSRALRQFGQFVIAGTAGAVLLADVTWQSLLTGAAASALSTLLIAALTVIPSGTRPAQHTVTIVGTPPVE